MQVNVYGSIGSTLTDAQLIDQIKRWFDLSLVEYSFFFPWQKYLDDYRQRIEAGNSQNTIVNTWKKKNEITPMQIAAFVNGAKRAIAGIPIQDPNETPSLSEIVNDYKNQITSSIPWGKVFLVGLAGAFVVWGVPNMFGKALRK